MAAKLIHPETDIRPVSDFRSHAAAILKLLRESGRPLILTQRGRTAAVLLDVHAYEDLVEEIETLRDVQTARADMLSGRSMAHDEARARLRARGKI